ncbi:MAG TPA: lysophospholipid acyltransferase family protein [Longimicrobiales bacterium]|nr:lysophospholipid acyltransferase family protein [Longimicrobiales bacterium]
MAEKVRLQHRLEYGAFRAGIAGVRALPEGRAQGLAWRLGRLGHRLGIKRDVAERNLRLAFPEASAEWVRRTAEASYGHLGRETLAMLRLSWMSRDDVLERTRIVDEAPARAHYEEGRGLVIVTGHLGNWEIGGAAVAARDYNVAAVAKRASNPLFYERIMAARARLGLRVIDFANATRASLRALRDGQVVALAADQHSGAGIWVPFFGRPAATFRGPAVMALRTAAPMYLAVCLRQADGSYEITLDQVDTTPTGDMEADVRRVTTSWVQSLEAAVRAHPEQYLWQHRRWREPPRHAGQEPASPTAV